MTTTTSPAPAALLRLALRLDAVVTGTNGAAYLLATPLLADLLGLPAGWLRGVGISLLLYGVSVWAVASKPTALAVRTVIAANALWAAGSVAFVLAGLGSPTTVGAVWVLLQAAVVGAFAVLQAAGLRRP